MPVDPRDQQGEARSAAAQRNVQHHLSVAANKTSSLQITPPQALSPDYSTLDLGAPSPHQSRHNSVVAPPEQDESYELVRAYESRDPVLPTSSPRLPTSTSSQSGFFIPPSSPLRTNLTQAASRSASRNNLAEDAAAGNMYAQQPQKQQQQQQPRYALRRHTSDSHYRGVSVDSNEGEDKVAEKTRAMGYGPVEGHGGAQLSEKGGDYASVPGAGNGKYAKFVPEQRPPQTPLDYVRWFFSDEVCMLSMYTVLSLCTRLYRIGHNKSVVWDEAHFGKFGSHYLKHEFYFDVHPPLGKMLVGLAGLLSGYGGQFEFKSGEAYPDDVNFIGMRLILAMFGVAMVPIAYSTSGALGWDWRTRHTLAIMVLLDNAWLVISRFILLDSMLLFFTFTTVHGLVMFHQQRFNSFGDMWWFWLTFTGASIGCVASVKWVGLFATALVGLYTIEDLWNKFGNLQMPVRRYARHWCARILCLIVVPLCVYMASFKMHFMILSRSGPGDAQMSSLFQAHLKGNTFAQAPLEAAFGSKVTFKNMGYGGGLLHSHIQTYPVGSQQQQVTCYHYRDNNNEFIITPTWEATQLEDHDEPEILRSGDLVRLVHEATGRNLHSHNVPAPVTTENLEISGYGNATVGDSNDYWVVEVVDDMLTGKKGKRGDTVHSLTTRMRFRHLNLGCYMRAANAILPQWGWKQVEVSCDKEDNPKDEHTYWNIETHVNDKLPMGNAKLYRSPFLRDFVHLNVAMMTSNNALIPDQDKEDILASKPLDWPWLYNGLRMNGWGDETTKYYLMGNPVIWWGSSFCMLLYVVVLIWYNARMQRRIVDLSPQDWQHFTFVGKIAGFGWLFHYVPFLLMARVCYIHHYLPTLYFAVLMMAHMLDHFLWNPSTARYRFGRGAGSAGGARLPLSETTKNLLFICVTGLIAGVFWWFRATAWGIDGPIWKLWGTKWRKTWNIKD